MKNILVRAPNWIGDQILAYPFYYYLRRSYPDAHIAAACVDWVRDIQFRDLVDEILVLPKPEKKTIVSRFFAVDRGARKTALLREWDLGISLPNSFSAAWYLFRAQAKVRRGYGTEWRGRLLNDRVQWDDSPHRHRAQAYVDLLPDGVSTGRPAREFWGIPSPNDLDPGTPGELSAFDPEAAWPHVRPIEPPAEPYWILAPGATAESRRWPLESFVQLARRVYEETGWIGLVIGGVAEAGIADELCHQHRERIGAPLKDYTARGPVSSLWKLFRQAKFTVCNESGLAHVAALCGSLVQIICGAADPRRTRPIGPGKVLVQVNAVECWPCERNFCSQPPENKIQCLRGIHAESVWESIRSFVRPEAAEAPAQS